MGEEYDDRAAGALTPLFRGFVALLGLACAAVLVTGFETLRGDVVEIVLWAAFVSAANLLNLPILPRLRVEANLGSPVLVAAAVVLAPVSAGAIGLLAVVSDREFRRGTSPWLIAFNRLQEGVSAGTAALAASWVFGDPGSFAGLAGAAALAALVYAFVNSLAIALGLWLTNRLGLVDAARDAAAPYPRFAVDFGFALLLALLVVVAYQQVGPWAVALLAMPLWLGYSALRSARESQDRAEELALRVRELETLNELSAQLLAVRHPADVARSTEQALRGALETERIRLSLEGAGPPGFEVVPVAGAEPAIIAVPSDLSQRSSAMVEATAGVAGMVLQRIAMEAELSENERALTRLAERILEEGTQERSRIAVEIHDDVLPAFAAAEIQIDNVRSALEAGAGERANELAETTGKAVHDGIGRLRAVLDALREQILVPGGLRDGLRAELEGLDLAHGVDGYLHADDPLPALPLAVEILTLETVRGCLANVARHAQARRVDVSLEVADGLFRVLVEDDGVGFDPDAVGSGHHGLVLMTQRVELARGRLHVDSAPGAGTRVQLEVPV